MEVSQQAPASTGPRVLVVDDVVSNRLLLREILRKVNLDVLLAENGHVTGQARFNGKDLLQMCLAEGRLDPQGRERLDNAMQSIESAFLLEFSELRTALKDAYGPLDPDADTRVVEAYRDPGAADSLAALLTQMLERANYDRVTREHVERALQKSSMFKVQLYVDMDDFREALLYTRGATVRTEEVSRFFGLGREEIEFINFDRVVLYIRFKDEVDTESTLGGCQPGSTMLKLFINFNVGSCSSSLQSVSSLLASK